MNHLEKGLHIYKARTLPTLLPALAAASAFFLFLLNVPGYAQTGAVTKLSAAATDNAVRPFRVKVPEVALSDLRRRIKATRWPERETVEDFSQGVQLDKLKPLVEYWGTKYDWRRAEAKLNALPQFVTNIDGLDIHFIHIRSRHPNAMPMLMTHGWPGSVLELLKVVDPLVNPTAHGGGAEDAFHLVLPSYPGYAFSGKPKVATAWGPDHVARAFHELMLLSSAANAITEGDTGGFVWRFQMKATDWGIVISRAAERLGFKTVGVMGLQNAFVLPIMKVFEERMTTAKRKVLDSLVYNPEQPSYRAEVERVFAKKPEAVFCFGLLPDFVSIMREVYRGGFDSKVVALSIMADAEGKFVQAVGPQVAEGIRHFQPMPDVAAPGYKKFVQLMGAPVDRVFLFPPNTHDQLVITALAMEKAKSPMAVDWSKQIIAVGNGPGEMVDDVVDALKLVRSGKNVNFQGAGSTCDFTPTGDQLGRGMGQWIIKGGKNQFVEYAKP